MVLFLIIFNLFVSISYACTAKNDSGDTCEITCPVGQSASCFNATGASPPVCVCSSNNRFMFSEQFIKLPNEQQESIKKVLIASNLMTKEGNVKNFTESDIPKKDREILNKAVKDIGIAKTQNTFNSQIFNSGCIAARAAEIAAVAACASVPGGQVIVAVCIATAHEIANQACK